MIIIIIWHTPFHVQVLTKPQQSYVNVKGKVKLKLTLKYKIGNSRIVKSAKKNMQVLRQNILGQGISANISKHTQYSKMYDSAPQVLQYLQYLIRFLGNTGFMVLLNCLVSKLASSNNWYKNHFDMLTLVKPYYLPLEHQFEKQIDLKVVTDPSSYIVLFPRWKHLTVILATYTASRGHWSGIFLLQGLGLDAGVCACLC